MDRGCNSGWPEPQHDLPSGLIRPFPLKRADDRAMNRDATAAVLLRPPASAATTPAGSFERTGDRSGTLGRFGAFSGQPSQENEDGGPTEQDPWR